MRYRVMLWVAMLALAVGSAWAADPVDDSAKKVKPGDKAPATTPDKTSDKAPAKPLSPAEEAFTQGRDALFQGKYDKAVELLKKAVEADKTKNSYRLHLAQAYRHAGQTAEAVKQLEDILKTTPDHVEAGQTLGEVYSAGKQWKDAVRVLEPLLKYRHDYPTYHMLAEAQYNLGEQEKARKNYEEAVKLNPESASDRYQLGNIYLAGNFFALASESYQDAMRLGFDTPVLHYKLGSALFNLRNYFGAISLQTIKSGKPGTINGTWYLIEQVPGRKDQFRCAPEASAVYQVAKALADGIEDRPDIHVLQASIYLNARRYAQAYDMFTQIGPKVPPEDKALFHYYYAQAAFGIGQYDRYLELLREAIRLNPEAYKSTLVDAYLKVADQYNQAGKLDRYIEFVAKAVAENPQTASAHLKLGYAYEEAQKYAEALAQWRMVLELEPDHPERTKLLNLIEKYQNNVQLSVGTKPVEKPKPKPEPKAVPKKSAEKK